MGISSTWQHLAGFKHENGTHRYSLIKDCSAMLQSAKWIILLSHGCPQSKSCHLNHKTSKVFHQSFTKMVALMVLNPSPKWSNHLKN
jgi:hypothetical protein